MNPDRIYSWTKVIGTFIALALVLYIAYQIYKTANKVVEKTPNLYTPGKEDTIVLGVNLDEPFAASKRALNWLSEKLTGDEMFPTVPQSATVQAPPGMSTGIAKAGEPAIITEKSPPVTASTPWYLGGGY